MRFLRILSVVVAVFFFLSCSSLAAAASPYSYDLGGGNTFSCADNFGNRVQIYSDYSIPDVGGASYTRDAWGNYVPYIVFNPNVLGRLNMRVRMFWFGHECGHHALGHVSRQALYGTRTPWDESETDCWAVRTLRHQYGFSREDIEGIAATLLNNPGSAHGHLPGPYRAQHLVNCSGF